ncbi:centrosome-associated protein CEP250 [Betta splendens]|uniref:Centrosome-associated protein CEP250 n=1 Tax=Betta splendens TaxID=158456 RepID=A0A9W2XVW8_BETSP|nr:centrosome-associated protein CEP250 [Betta splendens]
MWDSKYRLTAQRSAWCGMASVSGNGFLSTVNTSTSGSSGGFRQDDPGLRRWQSLSHLEPESFHSSLGSEFRGSRGEGQYRQSEVVQWLQDAREHLDTQLECLRTRDAQLSYHMPSAQVSEMTHRLSEALSSLEQETEAANLSQFEKNQKCSELREKVLRLEKDMMQMRLSLDRGGGGHASEKSPGVSRSHDDSNRQEKQKAAIDAEIRARKQDKEQNQGSAETQRMLLNQIEELKQRLSHAVQNHFEAQERLTDANNKISQACLEKAVLSTQVLKLEDKVKDLKTQLTAALSDKHNLTQEKETGSEKAEVHSNGSHNDKEVNEKLSHELGIIQKKLAILQSQLQERTAENVKKSTRIRDLEAEKSQLIQEKEELMSKMSESEHEMKERCCQLRESLDVLRMEKQKLQDQCLCLEAKLKNDAVRVQTVEELKAVASHWTEKWQQAASALQTLEGSNCRNDESDLLLTAELEAHKQQLELDRSRSQTPLHSFHKYKAGEAQDKNTQTDLSESSLSWESPPDHQSSHNKYTQVFMENPELQWLKVELAEKEKLLKEKTEALMSLETLRETEKNEARIRICALELQVGEKTSKELHDDVWTTDSLKAQLEESRRRMSQLQQEKMLAVQRLQTLQQIYQIKAEKQSLEGSKEKPSCPAGLETDQQRRMINEQLKNLFKEREEKKAGKIDNAAAAAATQTDSFSHQDQTYTPKAVRTPVDRWSWQLSSGLMPVYEEDEESDELPGAEEEEPGAEEEEPGAEEEEPGAEEEEPGAEEEEPGAEEEEPGAEEEEPGAEEEEPGAEEEEPGAEEEEPGAEEEEPGAEESLHNQRPETSAVRAAHGTLTANSGNRPQDSRFKQRIQHLDATGERASQSSNADLGSDELDLQWEPRFLCPDGVFLAQRVEACSPDGDDDK